MQKISTYLYPNRIELLVNLAGFPVEYTNVYQRTVKIYNGIDNTIEFDIKNADQKRIDLADLTTIELNVMDVGGTALPNSPYTVTPTLIKGIATVTIPQEDLVDLTDQYLKYSVSAVKNSKDVMLYADSRFGAVGTIELVGSAMPTFRDERIYNTFTGEIDLKGLPTYHSSAIPAKFYEAVATSELSFEVALAGDVNVPGSGFVGSIWLEATTNDTISVDSFKGSVFLGSFTASKDSPRIAPVVFTNIPVRNYSYFRVSYQTPTANGVGAAFTVTKSNNVYSVVLRSGGTAYAAGSQMKVLGSLVGGIDGINDLIITADEVGSQVVSSYTISSITSISWTGISSDGDSGIYIVSGTYISGKVVSVTVS